MNTLAWLFILAGLLIARQVSRGRTMEIGADLSDAFLAVISNDTNALMGVLARTGEANTPTAASTAINNLVGGTTSAITEASGAIAGGIGNAAGKLNGIAVAAIIRGEKAKGYRWAATGPDYYDCSGLIWRACQDIGYKGSRFSTSNIRGRKEFMKISAVDASQNDIALWPAGSGGITGHMGVVTGVDKFYSARSLRTGIGESSISSFRKVAPLYLRYKG